ncbi:FMN-binding negative transcriptional regulator [Kineococcus gypseus]|uniref:FMN-binding negative transcriptional regulator n=1 Tax=Kineococcus gypseus TaxID=1637102 RepID=UPI003D7C8865
MLRNRHFQLDDVEEVKRLITRHPWATFVSATTGGLVASHYPVLLDDAGTGTRTDSRTGASGDPGGTGIVLLSHFGRPDDTAHELGQHEVLVVVQGPHDYVSPSWYAPGELVPTWNHVTAHLWGVPELLDEEENYDALCRLTEHFERGREGGRDLRQDEAATRRAARGTRGLRLRVTRFQAKVKLSQNKDPDVVCTVIERVRAGNPELAAEMRAAHRPAAGSGSTSEGNAARTVSGR